MPPIDGSNLGAAMGRVLARLERRQLAPWLPQSMVEQMLVGGRDRAAAAAAAGQSEGCR
jgi:hypothetical protein